MGTLLALRVQKLYRIPLTSVLDITMNESMPADLGAAIAASANWVQIWVQILVVVNLAAVFFILTRKDGKFSVRIEAIAIVVSFFLAGAMMTGMYTQIGFVRLLGLPHLIFWLPVYVWLLVKFRRGVFSSPFKYYLLLYFLIAGMSLVIDLADVTRYLIGERQSLHIVTP